MVTRVAIGSLITMLGRIETIVVDCAEPARLVRFWAMVLGGQPVDRSDAWSYVDPPSPSVRFAFQRVPEGKQGKNRLHLDIAVMDIEACAARLEKEGATLVGGLVADEQGRFQVMRDPEGNEFCLTA